MEYDEPLRSARLTMKKPKWVIKMHAYATKRMLKGYPPNVSNVYREYGGECAYCLKATELP